EAYRKLENEHYIAARDALEQGKPVPPEVLKHYPDLQEKYGKGKAEKPYEVNQEDVIEYLKRGDEEPPVPQGMVRLYRGEKSEPSSRSELGEMAGKFWSKSPVEAGSYGDRMLYLDVPAEQLGDMDKDSVFVAPEGIKNMGGKLLSPGYYDLGATDEQRLAVFTAVEDGDFEAALEAYQSSRRPAKQQPKAKESTPTPPTEPAKKTSLVKEKETPKKQLVKGEEKESVSGEFYVWHETDEKFIPAESARQIQFQEAPNQTFFVARHFRNNNSWAVYEAKTGLLVTASTTKLLKTQKEAIEFATRILQATSEKIDQVVEEAAKTRQSPYKPTPKQPLVKGKGGSTGAAMAAQASAVFDSKAEPKKPLVTKTPTEPAPPPEQKLPSPQELKKQTRLLIRAHGGEMARKRATLERQAKKHIKLLNSIPEQERYEFVDAIEEGRPQKSAELSEAAAFAREVLDTRLKQVQAHGRLQQFIVDYFPHMWEDPKKATGIFGRIFGKRPLEGPKSFLKHRTIPTHKEGRNRDLKPVTDNPMEWLLLKAHEMDRFIMAHDMFNEAKEKLGLKFVYATERTPEGLANIDDPIATIYGKPTETISEAYDEQMMRKLQDFAESLGIDVQRKVKIGGRGRWGYAKGDQVVTKFGGPETVLSHEIGHVLDTKYGLSEKLKAEPDTRQELQALADLRFEGKDVTPGFKQYVRKMAEKSANLVHAFIHAPELLRETAPLSEDILNDLIRANPELEPMLDIKPSLVLGENKAELPIPGLRIMGRYAAPEPVARIFNNYLSPGLRGKKWYDIWRKAGNVLNQTQLAAFAYASFHTGTTILNSIETVGTLGVLQIFQGKPIKGLSTFIKGAIPGYAPFTTLTKSSKFLKEYYEPGGQGEKMGKLVDAAVSGGVRTKTDSFFHNSAMANFFKALHGAKDAREAGDTKANVLRSAEALTKSPGALLEAMSYPLMQDLVPKMKTGAVAMLLENKLEQLGPDATEEQIREAAAEIVDNVDFRLGQMIYDNYFFHKVLKDIGFATVRSVGWTGGTLAWLGKGAVVDPAQQVKRIFKGEKPEMTVGMASIISMAAYTFLFGAMLTYLLTGKGPKTLKDYIYIKTGKKRPDGTETRIALPTYSKDVLAYFTRPIGTLTNKLHPLISLVGEMWRNEDYYGTKVRNEDDPLVQQLKDSFEHIAEQFVPFGIRGFLQRRKSGESIPTSATTFIGLTPAAAWTGKTKAQTMMSGFTKAKLPQGSRTKQQAEQSNVKYELTVKMRETKGAAIGEIAKAIKEGKITLSQGESIMRDWQTDPRTLSYKRLTVLEAIKVYDAGTKEEKNLWRVTQADKIDRALKGGNLMPDERQSIIGYIKNLPDLERRFIIKYIESKAK
ncbi:MAG: hypothetical protein ABIH23_15450, partial [bacterium]